MIRAFREQFLQTRKKGRGSRRQVKVNNNEQRTHAHQSSADAEVLLITSAIPKLSKISKVLA